MRVLNIAILANFLKYIFSHYHAHGISLFLKKVTYCTCMFNLIVTFLLQHVYVKNLPAYFETAIAQLVEQWSRNPAAWVQHQGDALVPYGKAFIPITRFLGEDLKPSLLTNKHLMLS